jgi:hypothetical protein
MTAGITIQSFDLRFATPLPRQLMKPISIENDIGKFSYYQDLNCASNTQYGSAMGFVGNGNAIMKMWGLELPVSCESEDTGWAIRCHSSLKNHRSKK